MRKFVIFQILVVVLLGCSREQEGGSPVERTITSFVKRYSLTGAVISIENEQLLASVSNIWIYDSLLIVYDYTAANGNYFYAFHKDSYKLLSSFGRKGHGPGEGAIAGRADLNPESGQIIQHMQDKSLLYRYALDSALTAGAKYVAGVESRDFKDQFLFATNDRYYAGSNFGHAFNDADTTIMKVVERKTGYESKVGTRFATPGYATDRANMLFNMGTIVANEDKGRAVYGYVRFKRLAFVDLKAPFKTTIVSQAAPEPLKDGSGKLMDAMLVGFSHLCCAGEMVFCSPFRTPTLIDGVYKADNYPNTVQVFDWDGNPLMEFVLDRSVSCFVLDIQRRRLIGWDPTTLSPLVAYDLSQFDDLKLE